MAPARVMTLSAALTALAAALEGCGGAFSEGARERNPGPCPGVFILNDASRFVDFAGEPAPEAVAFSGEMLSIEGTCRYFDDQPIRARLRFDMAIGRGEAAETRDYDVTYFVAVTRRDRDLIAKEEFTRRVRLAPGEVKTFHESIDGVVIPRAKATTSGSNFEILVGFSLSREQAIYNRSGRSLKFPDAS